MMCHARAGRVLASAGLLAVALWAARCLGSTCFSGWGPRGRRWAALPARRCCRNWCPAELFSNAVTWNSSVFYVASVTGPVVGGMIMAMSQTNLAPAFAVVLACRLLALAAITLMRYRQADRPSQIDLLEKRRGGHPVRLEHEAHSGHDHARPVRRAAGRSHLSAAHLRQGHSARRPDRFGLPPRGRCRRRDLHGHDAGPPAAHAPGRVDPALGRRRLRRWPRSSSGSRNGSGSRC